MTFVYKNINEKEEKEEEIFFLTYDIRSTIYTKKNHLSCKLILIMDLDWNSSHSVFLSPRSQHTPPNRDVSPIRFDRTGRVAAAKYPPTTQKLT